VDHKRVTFIEARLYSQGNKLSHTLNGPT